MIRVSGLLDTEQLRAELGRIAESGDVDPVFATDDDLQGIIDRHAQWAEGTILSRIEERMRSGVSIADDGAFELVEVALTNDEGGTGPVMASGRVNASKYYPHTFLPAHDESGHVYHYDRGLENQAAFSLFERRRYKFTGDRIYVLPEETTTIFVRLAPVSKVQEYLGADVIAKANEMILRDAHNLVKSMHAEAAYIEREEHEE